MQPFSFFLSWLFVVGGGGISSRVRALNLTVPLGSGRVGSDDLGYGPGSGFSFEPVQTSRPQHNITFPRVNISRPRHNITFPRVNISRPRIISRSHELIC